VADGADRAQQQANDNEQLSLDQLTGMLKTGQARIGTKRSNAPVSTPCVMFRLAYLHMCKSEHVQMCNEEPNWRLTGLCGYDEHQCV
jgi:hypothetical protein